MIAQSLIILLTASGIGLLLWAVICVLTILYKSHHAERHDQRYTPKGTIIGFVITGLIGQILYWLAAWLILQGVAAAAVMQIQGQAQKIYTITQEYAEAHPEEKLHSVYGSSRNAMDYAPDSLEAEILREFPYETTFWFAVTVDNSGKVTGAYFAHHELTKQEMRPTDDELQKKMVLNPMMGENSIVGAWTMADQMRSDRQAQMWGGEDTGE